MLSLSRKTVEIQEFCDHSNMMSHFSSLLLTGSLSFEWLINFKEDCYINFRVYSHFLS